MDRRTFLKSSSSTLALVTYSATISLPNSSKAGILGAISLGLSFAGSVAGFLGGNRSAKASAKMQAAQIKMLEGLTESMDEVLKTQALMLSLVKDLPDVFVELLTRNADDERRVNILAMHNLFIKSRSAMISDVTRANDHAAVQRYKTQIRKDLRAIQFASTQIHIRDEQAREASNIQLRAICLRIEIDLSTELFKMGESDAFLPASIEEHLQWFGTVVNPDTEGSIAQQTRDLKDEIEKAERAQFLNMWVEKGSSRFLAESNSVTYPLFNEDGSRAMEFWDGDKGLVMQSQKQATSPVLNFYKVSREPLTAQYSFLKVDVEEQKYAQHVGGRFQEYAEAIGGKGFLDVPSDLVNDAVTRKYKGYLILRPDEDERIRRLGLKFSLLSVTSEIASSAIDLCRRTLRLVEEA